jgi:transposase
MKKRVFSREFKLDVVRQLVSGQKRFAQLCREHDVCETLLRRWREQYERDGEHAWLDPKAGDAPLRDAQARIAQLEAALGRATLENDFLRHALKVAQKGGSIPPRNGR